MADLPHLEESNLNPHEIVNINVEDRSIAFGHDIYTEYIVSSLDVKGLCISSCMAALHKYTHSQDLGFDTQDLPLIDLAVRLDTDKGLWEPGMLGMYICEDLPGFGIHFSVNSALGLQEPVVKEVIKSCLNDTMTLRDIEHDHLEFPDTNVTRWRGWDVFLSLPEDSRLLFDDLLKARLRIAQEIFFLRETRTMPYLLLRTIQMGNTSSLIGQTESEWLEVKSSPYDLQRKNEEQWKTELAQDVSQFANSADGGLLLIGFRTQKMNGIDIIRKITPVPHNSSRLQRYNDTLTERVHPPISGLQINSVPWGTGHIIYIFIPAQEDENKPYLVSGSKKEKAKISIVRRQGAACVPVTAQEIHAALVIGRAVMRNKQLDNFSTLALQVHIVTAATLTLMLMECLTELPSVVRNYSPSSQPPNAGLGVLAC